MEIIKIDKEKIDRASRAVGGDERLARLIDRTVRQIRNIRNGRGTQPYVLDKIEQIIKDYEKLASNGD
jgi:hypothetical protein